MSKVKTDEDWGNWDPEYGNASRPGLLSDGTTTGLKGDITIHQEDYKWPKFEKVPYARKKRLLKQFLFQEVANRYLYAGDDKSTFEMEKDTTYKSEHKGGGFQSVDIIESADPEVIAKYPLYTDQAHSVYFDKIKNIKTTFVSNDPQAAFRRYSYFSKPFYAELEE